VQSTLDREGEDLAIIVIWRDRLTIPFWELLSDPLMRSGSIEVVYISIEYPLELLLMQDEQVIETLASHTPQKAFTDSIRLWGMIRYVEDLDATRLRNPLEVHPKLAIIITDEVLRSLSIGGGFPQLLCGPSVGGISCDADVDHSARLQFNNEEGEKRAEKQVSDWETRHRPRSAQHECVRRYSTSVLVARPGARVSCTSEWSACRHVD
jgi:hypothetical protein